MLVNGNSNTDVLKRHIRHRFRSACMRERDNALLQDREQLGAEATEADEQKVLQKLMEGKGMMQVQKDAERWQPQ